MSSLINRRDLLVGTGATLSVASFVAACGGPYVTRRELPTALAGEEPIITVLRHGITAPSAHNTQPWRFQIVSSHEVRLFTDPRRLIPFTDPPARQTHISHGTLIEMVAIAATIFGFRAEISLLPDGDVALREFGKKPTASIRLVAAPSVLRDPLFDAVAKRRTSRLVHEGPPPTSEEVRAVIAAASLPEVRADVLSEGLEPLLDLIGRAMTVEANDDELFGETLTWFRFTKHEVSTRRDGLNPQTTGTYSLGSRLFLNAGNFQSESNRGRFLERFVEAASSTQSLFTLTTASNGLREWLLTGRAYLRAQLVAAQFGLHMHPVSQCLQECPQMVAIRDELSQLLPVAAPGKLQMMVRLGRTKAPEISPRRELGDMVM